MAPEAIQIQAERLMQRSSSLDLRADECDLTVVYAIDSSVLLKTGFAKLRPTDMIVSRFQSQDMTTTFAKCDSYMFITCGGWQL